MVAPGWAYNPTMLAIRNGFLFCLPLVTAGALATLLNNLPLPYYHDIMKGLFGEGWSRFGGLIWQGTFGILSLPMLLGISYHLAVLNNQQHASNPVSPTINALTALAALAIIMPTEEGSSFLQYLGTQGLFVSIMVGIISSRIFLRLARIRRLTMLIYSEGMEVSIQQAFALLLPGILTICLFAVFYFFFDMAFGVSIHQLVRDALLFPFQFQLLHDALNTGISYVFLIDLFWFFGIHGSNVLDPLTRNLFDSAHLANLAALEMNQIPPNIITKHFLDIFVFMGGSGSSICLLAAILVASKNNGSRRLAKISFIPGVFNINEILLFGLPVILNPIFFLPFVLTPLVLTATSYMAVYLGFVPLPAQEINWTTPPILGGYFATSGSVTGSILQIFNLILGTMIYIPFIRISDREKAARQKKAMQALMEIACSNLVGPSGKKCLDRDDEIGVLARALANDLEEALKNNIGLYLEYQPQFDYQTQRVIGAEALVRWKHPVYGSIPAPIMVAIAEDGDFMRPLGLWVLNEASAERARWRDAGLDDRFKTAVNISIQQLADNHLTEKVVACLKRYNLPHYMVGIEVTESIAIDPESPQNSILKELNDMGFIISMDDFGMGHSSLVYLKYFPVDILKIDRALSRDVASNQISMEVISTIVELCRALNVKIIVEYVENQEQIDALLRLGCHVFQGYFYSPPLPGQKLLEYAQNINCDEKKKTK
ncbi:MAG: EAL domain-containing protein [Betaproteobacteria bacterium]|nr:EAL domain-containing protein [Betaproteobacteria bacterium]